MDQPAIFSGIVALCGVWISLMAYGVIGTKPGKSPVVDRARAQFGTLNRISGPLVAVGGLIALVTHLMGVW
jgi:hypothetical protein